MVLGKLKLSSSAPYCENVGKPLYMTRICMQMNTYLNVALEKPIHIQDR